MSDDLDDDEDVGIDPESQTWSHTRDMLIAGLTASDLAKLFRVENRKVKEVVGALKPTGVRYRRPIYAVADVAPLVIKPLIDVEAHIRKLKPKDLPPALQKAFWDAQEARQSFEEKAGNLWHTSRVQEVIGKLVMLIRQRIVLATDQLDRMAPLTDEQRQAVQAMFDAMLGEMQSAVVEAFKDYKGDGDRQDIFENGPPKPFQVDTSDDVDDGLGDGL
jgi:hypothetical protein